MLNNILAFAAYYICAFCVHAAIHYQHVHRDPVWRNKPRLHKIATGTAIVGTAAGQESLQGFMVHMIVYSGYVIPLGH